MQRSVASVKKIKKIENQKNHQRNGFAVAKKNMSFFSLYLFFFSVPLLYLSISQIAICYQDFSLD